MQSAGSDGTTRPSREREDTSTHSRRTGPCQPTHGDGAEGESVPRHSETSPSPGALPATSTSPSREPAQTSVPLLDLQPGDRVLLPVSGAAPDDITWWGPVTVTSVLLIDSGLAQVRYRPQPGQEAWTAHALLEGPAYRAGAVRIGDTDSP